MSPSVLGCTVSPGSEAVSTKASLIRDGWISLWPLLVCCLVELGVFVSPCALLGPVLCCTGSLMFLYRKKTPQGGIACCTHYAQSSHSGRSWNEFPGEKGFGAVWKPSMGMLCVFSPVHSSPASFL